jgi:hypothetical protein
LFETIIGINFAVATMAHPCSQLRAIVKARQDRWNAELNLDISPEGDGSNVVDLMQYIGKQSLHSITRMPLILPPRFVADHKQELSLCLKRAARKSGFELLIHKIDKGRRVIFACRRHRLYEVSTADTNDDDNDEDHESKLPGHPPVGNNVTVSGNDKCYVYFHYFHVHHVTVSFLVACRLSVARRINHCHT